MLLASGAAAADTGRHPLPWNTFDEMTANVVSVEQVACPRTLDEPVLKAQLIHEHVRYVYLAKGRRWLIWRLQGASPSGEGMTGYVWFGNQRLEDDVLRVSMAMPYDEAQKYLRGPCGWIDPDMI